MRDLLSDLHNYSFVVSSALAVVSGRFQQYVLN